jgi:hypothetical protein
MLDCILTSFLTIHKQWGPRQSFFGAPYDGKDPSLNINNEILQEMGLKRYKRGLGMFPSPLFIVMINSVVRAKEYI